MNKVFLLVSIGYFNSIVKCAMIQIQGDDLISELAQQKETLDEKLGTTEISIFSGSTGKNTKNPCLNL